MELTVALVALVVTIVVVTELCRRFNAPAPIALVAVGVVGSLLPFIPEFRLTADLVLIGLLPPLLYNAALQTSLIDFKAERKPILSLSVGLVVFTTLGVGFLVHALLPEVGWGASFAIGAVVSPPDAVAATAVARRIGLPRRLVTILEGESLLNDATALVSLNTAIAAMGVSITLMEVTWDFARTVVGGIAAGIATYIVIGWVRRRFTQPVVDTSVSIVTPFIAYVVAEEIHSSGVLAVVIAGLLLGHRAPVIQTASSRVNERMFWRTASFLLENAVFVLIGLQVHWIVSDVSSSTLSAGTIATVCLGALATVIVLRLVWVVPSRYLVSGPGPLRETVVIGWAGMRGVVTLAAAFAIPDDTPHREVLVLAALVVAAGTLLIQGLSLPSLVRMLRVASPDPRQDALARAELLQEATQAGLARLVEVETPEEAVGIGSVLRGRLEQRDFAAWERLGSGEPQSETPSEAYQRLRLEMLAAERARVLEVRDGGKVPQDIVADVLATLDVEESMIDQRVEARGRLRGQAAALFATHDECDHLIAQPLRNAGEVEGCVDCLAEGTPWVHLRMCLTCEQVRCCDSSPRRHSTQHFHASGHPVMRSAEPGEDWRWCFVDEQLG